MEKSKLQDIIFPKIIRERNTKGQIIITQNYNLLTYFAKTRRQRSAIRIKVESRALSFLLAEFRESSRNFISTSLFILLHLKTCGQKSFDIFLVFFFTERIPFFLTTIFFMVAYHVGKRKKNPADMYQR